MKTSTKTMNTLIASAVAVTLSAGVASEASAKAPPNSEKCFGIVKAGKNMCGRADGKHSCAGHAKADGDAHEWIYLPKGACEKIVGGSLSASGASAKDGKHSCAGMKDEKHSCAGMKDEKHSCAGMKDGEHKS